MCHSDGKLTNTVHSQCPSWGTLGWIVHVSVCTCLNGNSHWFPRPPSSPVFASGGNLETITNCFPSVLASRAPSLGLSGAPRWPLSTRLRGAFLEGQHLWPQRPPPLLTTPASCSPSGPASGYLPGTWPRLGLGLERLPLLLVDAAALPFPLALQEGWPCCLVPLSPWALP